MSKRLPGVIFSPTAPLYRGGTAYNLYFKGRPFGMVWSEPGASSAVRAEWIARTPGAYHRSFKTRRQAVDWLFDEAGVTIPPEVPDYE